MVGYVRVAFAGLLVVGAAACSSGGGSSDGAGAPTVETPVSGGQLVVGIPQGEPEAILRLTLEPLTTFAADGSVVPYLAESVEPNDTFDRWTIRVRDGITFHNGEALDAEAVKANLDTYSVSELYGTDPLSQIVGTSVVDDRTVEVELSQPWASFPAHLTAEQSDGTGLIAAPATIAASGPLFLANPGVKDLYGTGPFVLDAPDASADSWRARRNQDYWQDGLPYVDDVEVRVLPDNTPRLAALDEGDIDIAITSRPPTDPGTRQVVAPDTEPQVLAVAFNMTRAPFDDPDLRAAAVAATDVEALAAIAGVDPSRIVSGPFATTSPWNDAGVEPAAHDPEQARAAVAAYEQANGPVRVRLSASDLETDNVAVQQELARQWTDAGIDVELSVVDPFAQTATLLVAGDFDAVIGNQFGMPDPDMHYFRWHSSALKTEGKGAGYNFVGIDDAALDAALDEARGSDDETTRRAAMATVQERLADTTAYVWLWSTPWSVVASDRVHGLDGAPLPGGGTRLAMVGPRLNLEGVWLQQ